MKICITVGHSKLKNGSYTSSSGIKVEYLYCKEQAKSLKEVLEKEGHQVTVIQCPEGQFIKPLEEKSYKLSRINGKGFDLVVELHLNCYNKTAKGTEVLYYPTSSKSKEYADRVVKKLATKFTNRGIKARNDLYILRDTDCKSILIESFFCDNKTDCDIADKLGYKGIAKLIAEGVLNKTIEDHKINANNTKWAVCVGAWENKSVADVKVEELKQKGYTDTYLIPR